MQHADLTPLRADLARAAASAAHSSDPGVLDRIQTMTQRAWQADPAATTAQIASWPEGAARDKALQSSGSIWAEGSTADALTWAETLPPQQQAQALAGIMNVWAANEPADASEYIATLPAGPERDAPVSAFARGLSRIDPAASLQWAATVQDPALRSASLTEIFAEFFKQDAAAARASLENVPGLTPAERQQFGNPPPAK